MRRDFVKQMLVEMEQDENIFFLTGDLGFNALEPIRDRFPDRFMNAGIAEQHMIGMSAGLALEGKKVIAYSIASFATMRPYEQIRDDVCYHNLDVKIVGTGGGYNYAAHGVTHHTVEDVAIMNVLPHMNVLMPGYSWEAREATKAMIKQRGPCYIRLGKTPGIPYEKPGFKFKLGRGYVIREGKKIILISSGNVLDIAVKTAEELEELLRAPVGVISMPSIKPYDEELLVKQTAKADAVFTIEEHSVVGGLGSITSSLLFKHGFGGTFDAFGLPANKFIKDVGDRDYLLARAGLEPSQLVTQIQKKLRA